MFLLRKMDDLAQCQTDAWCHVAPDARVALTANTLFTQLDAAEQGLGLAVLPCYIADRHPQLMRYLSPTQCVSQDIWLVIQQGLRAAPRVRVIADMVAAVVSDNRKKLEGNPH